MTGARQLSLCDSRLIAVRARNALPGARLLAPAALIAALMLALTGCWPFQRGPTPEQQFFDALNRGDAAQASELWLKMSQADREKLRRGEGLTPRVSPEQVQERIQRRRQDATEPAADGAPTAPGASGGVGGWLNIPPEALQAPNVSGNKP